jgi:hypothetical protein
MARILVPVVRELLAARRHVRREAARARSEAVAGPPDTLVSGNAESGP